MSNVLGWMPAHGHNSVGQLKKKLNIHQLSVDTGYHLEDLLRAMTNRDRWQERQMTRETDRQTDSKESILSACLDLLGG